MIIKNRYIYSLSSLYSNLMLNLEYLLEIVLCEWSVLIFVLTDLLFLLLDLILDCELVLASFDLRCDHEDVVERHNHWVVIVEVLGLLQLLGKQEGVLLDHVVNHVLDHAEVHHDVVLGEAMGLLHLFEFSAGFVVYQVEDFLDIHLDLVDLLDGGFVFNYVLLVFALTLFDFLFELFLELLSLVVFTKALVSVLFNFLLDPDDFFI